MLRGLHDRMARKVFRAAPMFGSHPFLGRQPLTGSQIFVGRHLIGGSQAMFGRHAYIGSHT